jgi:signal transduction histidine kinase
VDNRIAAIYKLGQMLIHLYESRQIAEAVLEIAGEVPDIQDCDFLLVDEARRELFVAARRAQLRGAEDLRLPLDGEKGITVAAARSRQVVYVPDVRQDPRYVSTGFPAISELAIPVMVGDRVLGVINVESAQPDAFDWTNREYLSILADQTALALENAHLHTEERRRAEELARVNRIAQQVNASLDLRLTLNAIVEAVAELVPCSLAEISLWDEEKEVLILQALRCDPERAFPLGQVYPPGKGYTGWVVRNKRPLLVPDVADREDIQPELLPGELLFKAYLGLPLLCCDQLIGTLVLIHDQANTFGEQDLRLLESLSEQAAAAIHNASLYKQLNGLYEETQRQAQKLAALNAVAAVINQPLSLQEILDQAVAKMVEVMEADGGAIRLLEPGTGDLVLVAFRDRLPDEIPIVERFHLEDSMVDWLDRFQVGMVFQNPTNDPRLAYLGRSVAHIRTLAVAPVVTRKKTMGIIGVSTIQSREFTAEDLDLLSTIGHQVGIAVERDHLYRDSLNAERLAAIGRFATSVAHDLRSPLGGILRSSEFLARPELTPATRQKVSQAIVSLTRRLINTSQQILDYVQKDRLSLHRTPCKLSEFLDEALSVLAVDFSDQGIEVERMLRYKGEVWMDGDRMAQVIYNLVSNARDAMPNGGKIRVCTRKARDQIEIIISDTGPGVPEELEERIFEPFVSHGKRQGAGLGLAIARRIVKEHGGMIRLKRVKGWGATFVITLPL